MTTRKPKPNPKEVTIKADAELIVTRLTVDGSTPLARGGATLGYIGHARTIDVWTPDGMIRIVVK